jgi:hypothetical protein
LSGSEDSIVSDERTESVVLLLSIILLITLDDGSDSSGTMVGFDGVLSFGK